MYNVKIKDVLIVMIYAVLKIHIRHAETGEDKVGGWGVRGVRQT